MATCHATMSRQRFQQINPLLRFDDPVSLAPNRSVFDVFNRNVSIDEQLLEFHGGIKFRQ